MNTDKLKTILLLMGLEGWNNQTISKKVGIHEMTISRIMTGKTKQVRAETMKKFADGLGLEVEKLI